MTTPSPRGGARRAGRIAVAAAAAVALAATGAAPAFADGPQPPSPGPVKPAGTVKSPKNKLGSHGAELLAKAKSKGERTVTMMIATAPGQTGQIAGRLDAIKGASVGKEYGKLGYVRATVPTDRADAAIAEAQRLPSVHGIDLKQEIKLPDPTPRADAVAGAKGPEKRAYPAPDRRTPAKNPYQPAFETGAVDFVEDHPKADGRGVTIGILDSGVDLGHPALRKTSTGERKIVDWVTSTDPLVDGDDTWLPVTQKVSGPSFSFNGRSYKAPAGDYRVALFAENATAGGDMKGDLNRDGDTTDTWAVLYDQAKGTVRVDLDDNGDFGNDEEMKPYKDGFQVGYFGKDDPKTPIAERIPFVVQIRKDVPLDPAGPNWVGKKADFVNIGVIESEHGTHVAGITAANGLFGGKMNGAAPGAKLVSSRACTWSGGCTNVALTEGMIDLVVNRGVDIVNMSIGGLPALNDGNNARSELYTRLIDTYGVQLVVSAGNSGPGANTIGDPGLADKVLSVGASVSKETWAANYGSEVRTKYAMMPFSSRGPREDGGFTPVVTAPGASVNTTPTWEPGAPVAESGYELPPGYGMLQGTSMAAPQAAGASALLISAAKQKHMKLTPADLRTALTGTAKKIKGFQAYEQGSGLIDVNEAWDALRHGATAHEYAVKAPVSTALSGSLKTPGFGTGLYDREGGLKAGESRTYDVTITRTSGPAKAVWHELKWRNNDGTFKLAGSDEVRLPLNEPVTVKVVAKAKSAGIHSGILSVDDDRTEGVDKQIMTTVVVADPLAKPSYAVKKSGTVQRNATTSYFVTVPKGAKSLQVAIDGLAKGSQTRFIAINSYGMPVDPTSTVNCYPNYDNPKNTCRPDVRSYANPLPGVWEIEVESRRTSPLLDNPYTVSATVLGASFEPATATVAEAKAGTPVPVTWKATNGYAPFEGKLQGGRLGSSKITRPEITQGQKQTAKVTLGAGVTRFEAAIGGTADAKADLDLVVYKDGKPVGSSTSGGSDEQVVLANPAAGEYTVEVAGYSVPSGKTAYDYRDVYYAPSLGEVKVDAGRTVKLGAGESAQVEADVVVAGAAPEGRTFAGEVRLVNERGTVAGSGSVKIEKVVS
ncbi:S8 family serine peptidase [Streptomyces sp. AV19]|uniref:S8 family serine peptidase n=1 Tax=Streptomyces sp. AV19 TaxID=2793068 RepID=UPI0018FE3774|nr:S8 family serine peptidase [Streptomyces sp. AV19]MBH1933068.1 S8 family serine peptidase [Streptomyces sp. AV19]MDG4531780.1 S8 family serine peptidase [Streptomyces sp. AV19]